MSRTLERFGQLAGQGPRNKPGRRPDQFVLEDLLVALGWIGKPHVADGLLAKYSGSDRLPQALINAVETRWKIPSRKYKLTNSQFSALCRLAITEHFDPTLCNVCQGTKEYMRWHKGTHKRIVCQGCGGTGKKPFSLRSKARALDIHKNTWGSRHLETLYQRMLDSLHQWETHGRRKVDFYLAKEHRRIE